MERNAGQNRNLDDGFHIRLGTEADIPCISAMADAFRRELGRGQPSRAEFAERIAGLIDDPDTDYLVALDDGGSCAGFLQQRYRRDIWTTGGEAYIEDLFVAQESRRRGLGKRLVETAVEGALTRGCSLVTLDTNERNGPAIALYESVGFACGGGPATDLGGGRQLWLTRRLGS